LLFSELSRGGSPTRFASSDQAAVQSEALVFPHYMFQFFNLWNLPFFFQVLLLVQFFRTRPE
jgi:hypothetical protein